MYRLVTRNKPRGKLVRDQNPNTHAVRVYQGSPEELILQLWSGKRYMLVALLPDEARAIAAQLMAVATELHAPENQEV